MSIQDVGEGLDRSSGLPYYLQIRDALLDEIRKGGYPRGTRLPSESSLADRFGVTRMTVRQALADLRRSGHIVTDKGRGSIVVEPRIEQSLLRFYSFGRRFRAEGDAFVSTLIKRDVVDSGSVLEDSFGGESCFRIVRLRSLAGVPLILETAYLPVSLFPGILEHDLAGDSLYDLLEREYRHPVMGAREYLEPRLVAGNEARLLAVSDGSPVFYTERHSRDAEGRLIEIRASLIRGDRLRFSAELPVGLASQ